MTTPTPAELAADEIAHSVFLSLSERRRVSDILEKHLSTTRKAAIEECVKVLHGHHGTRMEKATYPLDQYTIGNLDATIELANKLQSLLK